MVMFPFMATKFFLSSAAHSITIPKQLYGFLEAQRLSDDQEMKVVLPGGVTRMTAKVCLRHAGHGNYYQIRFFADERPDSVDQFAVGEKVAVLVGAPEGQKTCWLIKPGQLRGVLETQRCRYQ
jgi:hypothetical protein